jgi:hypothetical protein
MMSRESKRLLNAILLLSLTVLHAPAVAQNRWWRDVRGKPLVEFDWNCAAPSAYPGVKLDRIVKATMKLEDFVGAGTWGDRAFVFDLDRDRKPEYFVPLDCGATGNCTWGVFALNPTRLMGLLGGQFIYAHSRKGRYPTIITYTHMSAAEGILATYRFRKGRYVWLGDEYPTDVRGGIYGNKVPEFLDKARAACGKLGY